MPERCQECGANLPESGDCRELFHELLVLESQVPGAAGSLTHFYTVACYVLQHSDSFQYREEMLVGLHTSLCEALDGKAMVEALRYRAREGVRSAGRVTRRLNDARPTWKRGGWPVTAADIRTVTPEAYGEAVVCWAHSIRASLAEENAVR
jgi:hypothetical protein